MIAAGDVERFRAAIVNRLGLRFEHAKLGFLDEVLRRRLAALDRSSEAYLYALEMAPTRGELGALAQELTVTETYFFRNNEQFRALAEIVLPLRMRSQAVPKTLRLLSAGCASGEEAYTLAIVAREAIADPSWQVAIEAFDVNPAGLEKARHARFSAWALRETPADIQRKWFRPDGRDMILDEAVRSAVRFDERNLAAEDPELWQPDCYDAIFCRNVLMYFAPEQARAVIARLARALAPGGFLFLGHAETLRGLSDDFCLHHTHGTFYYERKPETGRAGARPMHIAPQTIPVATFSEAWIDLIRDSSERIEALVAGPIAAPPPDCPPPPAWDRARALDLLRKERFPEALAYLRGLPPGSEEDAEALLLEAMLLVHSGALAAAEDTCRRLLRIDAMNAGAHYVLALCRESAGDREGSAEHDRLAAYLDAAFAMPRLHLGLLARRTGNRDSARRDLGQALVLLKGEDASRLLLFGGGFNREALVALCGSALRDCGGQA
jgi:chemotaxis protein methyltransferase CheR